MKTAVYTRSIKFYRWLLKKILNVVPVGIYNLNLISDNYTQFFSNSEDTQRTEGFRKCSLETTLICLTNIFICDLAIHGKTLGNARTFVFTAPQHRAHSRTRNSNVYSWAVYNRIEHTKQIDQPVQSMYLYMYTKALSFVKVNICYPMTPFVEQKKPYIETGAFSIDTRNSFGLIWIPNLKKSLYMGYSMECEKRKQFALRLKQRRDRKSTYVHENSDYKPVRANIQT